MLAARTMLGKDGPRSLHVGNGIFQFDVFSEQLRYCGVFGLKVAEHSECS